MKKLLVIVLAILVNCIVAYIGYLIYIKLSDFQYPFANIIGATMVFINFKVIEVLEEKINRFKKD